MNLLIPFARRRADGKLVDVESVARGKLCGCVCPGCQQPVLAKHCTQKTSHFAHVGDISCEGAYESSIHAASKQIISELGYLHLPDSLFTDGVKFQFSKVDVESEIVGVKPDMIAYSRSGKPLAVEFYVTHRVDDAKREVFRRNNLACVEFHLCDLPRDINYERLKLMFSSDEIFADWIFNAKVAAIEAKERRREEAERKVRERKQQLEHEKNMKELSWWLSSPHAKARELVAEGNSLGYIRKCPLGMRGWPRDHVGVAFLTDCHKCPYCAASVEWCSTSRKVRCIGHFPKLALADPEIIKRFGGHPDRLDDGPIAYSDPEW